MIGYSATGVFTLREQTLLEIARILIEWLPEIPGLRCHEIARAVGMILGLEVQDGKYGLIEHSWLIITMERRRPSILDVYTVGSLPPVRLIDMFPCLPHGSAYTIGLQRIDIDDGIVLELVEHMQKKLLGI